MITRYDILNEAAARVGSRNDAGLLSLLGRFLNKVLVSISESHSFHNLRRTQIVDLSEQSEVAGQEGLWLPGNVAGVDGVQDLNTGRFFVPRDTVVADELHMPRYTVYNPGLAPLFFADDLMISKGATSFTSPTLDADGGDYTGEWVRFHREPGLYHLVGPKEIGEVYNGEQISQGDLVIRPSTTKKIVMRSAYDSVIKSGSANIHYHIYHPPMYRDSDVLLIPFPEYVSLLVAQHAVGNLSRRDRNAWRDEIEEKRREVVRLNPSFHPPSIPKDRIGRVVDPANVQYVRRGGPMDVRNFRKTLPLSEQ